MKRDPDISALMKPMKREDVTDLIAFRRLKKGLKWADVAQKVGQSKEWTTAACLGQMQMTRKQAETLGRAQNLASQQCHRFGGRNCMIRAWVCDAKG